MTGVPRPVEALDPEIGLPRSTDPLVSIVVLAWRQADLLDACLRSLAQHDTEVPFEVVLVLNGATAEVRRLVADRVQGAVVVDSSTNLGFAGGNVLGASVARGEHLVLLNDDAEVLPGWLDQLVAAVDRPTVGAVGSLVLFPDGTVQDAGGAIWPDGWTSIADRHHPVHIAARRGRRRVHYASGCSLLVRREAWDAVGGLDTRYHPAYFEDVDLCLALDQKGWEVLVEPTSMILHHESASSTSRFKSFLFERNHRQLLDKWGRVVTERPVPPPGAGDRTLDALAMLRRDGPRILVVDDRAPRAAAGSGFPRTLELLVQLAGRPHLQVAILPTAFGDVSAELDAARLGIQVLAGDFAEQCRQFDPDLVVVSRPHNAARALPVLRDVCPRAVVVADVEALFHRRLDLQAEVVGDAREAARLRREARRVEAMEREMVVAADHVITLSVDEHAWIESVPGHATAHLVPPWSSNLTMQPSRWEERRDTLFVAGWAAGPGAPNSDGLIWYHDEVLPRLLDLAPDVGLDVTGGRPAPDVAGLAGPHLRFTGRVDDLAEVYQRARVAVAPVRFGAGVKLKVMEALQMGVPVVTTSVGAEGFEAELRQAIVVHDDPADTAAAVARLATDRDAWFEQRLRIEVACARTIARGAPTIAGTLEDILPAMAAPDARDAAS
ncbi:glycosyltransferase [Actinomarinicola tropica]|uniref:Glycosyltransferase n=1 Tax=Actinomarinicola tropica TaxID=2789776 RepID=A0A5Q2RRN0_9ACTN|nr:glycosyltransferase [Actinomarinicola tropica]QGG95845.1 glycosyltransferase [Actinomarinicola tropica]